jgi:hypothetical protein
MRILRRFMARVKNFAMGAAKPRIQHPHRDPLACHNHPCGFSSRGGAAPSGLPDELIGCSAVFKKAERECKFFTQISELPDGALTLQVRVDRRRPQPA